MSHEFGIKLVVLPTKLYIAEWRYHRTFVFAYLDGPVTRIELKKQVCVDCCHARLI